MKVGETATTTSTKRSYESSLGAVPTSHNHSKKSKRTKRLSPTTIASSKSGNTCIDDLPDVVLVEILCRLPCKKLVLQCKCVSKPWRALISDPYFIGRFLNLLLHKQNPPVRTLINRNGQEILSRMWLLAPLFEKLVSSCNLKKEPVVVGTYNDLVLCCTSEYEYGHEGVDYYMCNPFTMQWVALPPTPTQCHRETIREGFVCDIPYYDHSKDADPNGHTIDADYRFGVVRILPHADDQESTNFKVEIFSSETGKWRESVVSSPITCKLSDISSSPSFAYNGVVYWLVTNKVLVIGLRLFNDPNNSTTSSNTGTDSSGFIAVKTNSILLLVDQCNIDQCNIGCLGVRKGHLYTCQLNSYTGDIHVCEYSEHHGNLRFRSCLVSTLDKKMFPGDQEMCAALAFDPNNTNILYLDIAGEIFMYNYKRRSDRFSKMAKKSQNNMGDFPLVLPRWPTPVPTLQT